MERYINPYTDFGSKKLFGEEDRKALLADLSWKSPASLSPKSKNFNLPPSAISHF
jgi:hypothetical protein